MTAVLVGFLVVLAALMWTVAASPAGPTVRRSALDLPAGRDAAARGVVGGSAGGLAGASPTPRWSGWLAPRRRRQRADRAEAEALELLDGLAPALRAGLPPVTALRLVTSTRTAGIAARAPLRSARRSGHRLEATGRTARRGSDAAAVPGDPLAPGWTGRDAAASRGGPLAPGWTGLDAGTSRAEGDSLAPGWTGLDAAASRGGPLAPGWTGLGAGTSRGEGDSLAPGWTGLDAAASRGDPLAPTWAAYAAAVDSDDLRLVAAAWSLCETLGSPLAPTVTTVADVVRRRRAVRHRIAAALAGPQATMRVLTALPLSGPLVAVVVGVAPAELYAGAAGVSSLVVGLLLLLVGRVWASRMVRAVTAEHQGSAASRPRFSDVIR